MFEQFPYADMQQLNLDWMIKIAKDFLDQYTHIQQLIADGEESLQNLTEEGLQQLQEKADNLTALLQAWYNEHSEDIANQLADALNDLNDWYTEHQGYLDSYVSASQENFENFAEAKIAELLSQIPADYTDIFNGMAPVFNSSNNYEINNVVWYDDKIYRFTRTHPAGAWLGTDAVQTNLGDVLKRTLIAISPDNHDAGYNDCNTFPANRVIICLSSSYTPAHSPVSDFKGVFFTLSNQNPFNVGCHMAISTNNKFYFRYGDTTNGFSDWKELVSPGDIPYILGLVKNWTGTLSGETNTQIVMKANTSYIIKRNKPFTNRVNVFGYGNTSNSKKWYPYQDYIRFTNDNTDRWIVIYDIGSHQETLDISVFEDNSDAFNLSNQTEYYTVNKDARDGDFTSITECFLALKDNVNPKVIYIDGGDYDIFQEYIDAHVPIYTGNDPTADYFDYCVWTPPNSHIIGRGIVRMIWQPAAENITYNQSHTCSPLNVVDNCFIENIEVYCKNGRYCLHNDALGMQQFSEKIQHFKNMKFYKELGDIVDNNRLGKVSTIGFGIDAEQRLIYENCEFYNNSDGRAFYGHARTKTADIALLTPESSAIDIINCIIKSETGACMRLGCVSDYLIKVRVKIENTYLSGQIRVTNETEGSTPTQQNNFDITMLNCSNVSIYYEDPTNPYPPKIYTI